MGKENDSYINIPGLSTSQTDKYKKHTCSNKPYWRIETGVEELDQEKLPILLTNKYQSLEDAKEILGNVKDISQLFIDFQKYLYEQRVA